MNLASNFTTESDLDRRINTLEATAATEAAETVIRRAWDLEQTPRLTWEQRVRIALVSASAFDRVRRPLDAIEALRARLREPEALAQRYWRGRCASLLGSFYLYHYAEIDASIKLYESALSDFETCGDREWTATTLSMLGVAYRTAELHSRASHYYETALKRLGTFATPGQHTALLSSLGAAEIDQSRFRDADNALTSARIHLGDGSNIDDALRATVLAHSAVAKAGLADRRGSEQYLQQAATAVQRAGTQNAQITLDIARARCYELTGKLGRACDTLDNIIRSTTDSVYTLVHREALTMLVRIAKADRDYPRALQAVEGLNRFESRLRESRGKLKLAEQDAQRNLDQAQAFASRLQQEVTRQTRELEDTVRKLEREAEFRLQSEKRNEYLSAHDVVTGLATRRRFISRLETVLSGLPDGKLLPVVLIGLEVPPSLKGRIGIARIDGAIARAAKVIQETLPDAFIARYSDMRFAVILDIASAELAEPQATESTEIACHALGMPIEVDNTSITFSAYGGIAFASSPQDSVAKIVSFADAALEKASRLEHTRSEVFDESLEREMLRRAELQSGLSQLSEANGLYVTFQPLVSAESEIVRGFESLVRWSHPEYGEISPVEFIPMAESIGVIPKLGLMIAEIALRDFIKVLLPAYPDTYLSVNVSMLQLREPHFVSDLLTVCRSTGVMPHMLLLEITESQISGESDTVAANLTRLRGHGFRLAIDDFGTGYSSLWRLSQIDMQTIKIARELVIGAQVNAEAKTLLSRAVQICHDLGRIVVAEGIEGDRERDDAINAGCDQLQGYLYSRPLRASQLITHLQTRLNRA